MILGVFGDGTASVKLITAALNDTLEAHRVDAPGEPFSMCIGVRSDSKAELYRKIVQWAERNEINIAFYTPMKLSELRLQFDLGDLSAVGDYHPAEKYMIELVDHLITEGGKIYALLGDQEPSVEVRRALARALDNGLEVRDLAEAGLTYVGVSDNPLTTRSIIMANDLTLAEAGEAADNDDEESMAALTELAGQYDLDPDDFPTWAELADKLNEVMAEAPAEEEAEEEEEAPKPRRGGRVEKLTRDDLEEKSVPELRQLAKQLGVEGWDKNRTAKLVDGILEAQDGGGAGPEEEPAEDEDRPPKRRAERASVNGDGIMSLLARGLRAFADALDS